jgi:hypothetical protein
MQQRWSRSATGTGPGGDGEQRWGTYLSASEVAPVVWSQLRTQWVYRVTGGSMRRSAVYSIAPEVRCGVFGGSPQRGSEGSASDRVSASRRRGGRAPWAEGGNR